jgi:hypothetical protein
VQGRRAGVKAVVMRYYSGGGVGTFRVNVSYEFSLDVSSPICLLLLHVQTKR